jgi:hypothetical protein
VACPPMKEAREIGDGLLSIEERTLVGPTPSMCVTFVLGVRDTIRWLVCRSETGITLSGAVAPISGKESEELFALIMVISMQSNHLCIISCI